MQTPAKPPAWYLIVVGLAIAWSLVGVASFGMDLATTEEGIAAMPPEQRELYEARPAWMLIVYAVAVFGSLIGCVLLAFRKTLATPVLAASLAAIVVQFGYVVFGMNVVAKLGAGAAVLPAVVFVIGALLVWFAMQSKSKGWLA